MSVDPKTRSLFEAISAVKHDRVKFLIALGVNVNSPNDRGQTPLAAACLRGDLEIVDSLVNAGAKMQPQPEAISSAQVIADSRLLRTEAAESPVRNRQIEFEDLIDSIDRFATSSATDIKIEITESPAKDSQIEFEDLIDLMHQPLSKKTTELEQIIPTENKVLVPEVDSYSKNHDLATTSSKNNYPSTDQNISSEDEATYVVELDNFTATKHILDNLNIFDSREIVADSKSKQPVLNLAQPEAEDENEQSYAFDLSADLARLTGDGSEQSEHSDSSSMSIEAWGENATYMMDLDSLDRVTPSIETVVENSSPQQLNHNVTDLDRLFLTDRDDLLPAEVCEDGETYAIDLDDLQISALIIGSSPAVVTSLNFQLDRPITGNSPLSANDDGDDTQYDLDTALGHKRAKSQLSEDADLNQGYDENATNTSLMVAVIDGDLHSVQQEIQAGANLDRYDWNMGYSPLGMAIDRGHLKLVECLLTAGANPHCGSTSHTAIGLATERGEIEIVQMLLTRGVDVNAPIAPDDWTALLAAIQNGHRSIVELLVSAGANVNVWSRGETPILLAAKSEEREIYNYLYPLVNTAIQLCADRDGEQLLQAAYNRRIRQQNRQVEKFIEMATMGNVEEINRVIEIGIEIDQLGAKGHTALMAAAYYGHRKVVNILLAAGANPDLLSDDDGLGTGMTALMMAVSSFFASNRHQIARSLIVGGANVDRRGIGGKTAIFYAALTGSGYKDCVEMLIAAQADLDLHDDLGHTVLTAVAVAENYQMLNLLMQAGASTAGLESIQLIQAAAAGNVDRVQSLLATKVNLDFDRGAAIRNAATAGHTKIVELLIRAGANVNLSDRLEFTPISSAAYAGYADIVSLLITAGANIQAPAIGSQRYSALEYARMGMYQFDPLSKSEDLQHGQIIKQLEQLGAL